jgi:hypothetical protein
MVSDPANLGRQCEDRVEVAAAARLWLAMWKPSWEGHRKFKLSAEIWQRARMSRELKA